ncbi:MAG: 50S ribosomal protein L3 [Microgenomates group bacterium]
MVSAILGTKIEQTQKFTEDGKRIPVTKIKAGPCWVVQIKTPKNDGYSALQLGFGEKKNITKPLGGHLRGAGLKTAPLYLKEVKISPDEVEKFKLGQEIKAKEVFKIGDKVKVTGWSKGKGFTGVVKRWHFKGGPRTHGQSDRERAPGSIGQRTTPGRVYKGKKMAGRAGGEKVTVSGLIVTDIGEDILEVKGLVPGPKNGLLIVQKYA